MDELTGKESMAELKKLLKTIEMRLGTEKEEKNDLSKAQRIAHEINNLKTLEQFMQDFEKVE